MLTIVGTVKTSITFENTTKYYLVVADGEKVIFHGTKGEAQNVYDDPESTKGHSLLEIVAPGGKTSNDFLQPITEDKPQKSTNIFET